MFMRRSVYEEVRGFDEQYFMYGEDIDLSYTIQQAGYFNYYKGDTSVIHFKGESTVKDAVYRRRFYGAMHLFYNKHLKKNVLERALVVFGLQLSAFKAGLKSTATSPKELTQVSGHYLISDTKLLQESLGSALEAEVTLVGKPNFLKKSSHIIFDMNFVSYSQALTIMEENAGGEHTYKFIPKNSTFAVGSNSSEGRGEVLLFDS